MTRTDQVKDSINSVHSINLWKCILCLLGIHDWKYLYHTPGVDRVCTRCKKEQNVDYNMDGGVWYK